MCNENKMKITITANTPSERALKEFQRKLFEIHQSIEEYPIVTEHQ